MSFNQLSPLSDSLIYTQPAYKRRKLSDPVGDLFEKTHKRPAEPSDENGAPLKRRKVEIESNSLDCEMREIINIPLIRTSRPISKTDRFIPRSVNGELFDTNLKLDTPYKKHLASALFNSTSPNDEKILHFSSNKEKKKHPYDPSTHNPPLDSIKHPACVLKKTIVAPDLEDDFYHQALAYNQNQDCLAVILGSNIFLKKGDKCYPVPFDPEVLPTALAFNPEGTALLVSLENGCIGVFDLSFDQDNIASSLAWTSSALQSGGSIQRNHLLISDAFIFVGTEDGRICRISRSNFGEIELYENIGGDQILGLALSPDGKSLLAADCAGLITLFDVNSPRPVHQLRSLETSVKALAFSPCGRFFVAGGATRDPRIVLFSIEDQQIKEVLSHYIGSQTTALFWHKDYVLSTHYDGMIRTFSVNSNHFSLISPPKHHRTPALGKRLTYAALKQDKSSDILFVGCGPKETLFEIEIQKPRVKPPKTRDPFSSYNTIR